MEKPSKDQNNLAQWSDTITMSNLNKWEWDKKSGVRVEKGIPLPTRQLSHVLLAEQQKDKIKKEEERIIKLADKIELNDQKIQAETTLLNDFQSAYVSNMLNDHDATVAFSMALQWLWFEDVNSFLSVYTNEKLLNEYLNTQYPDEKSRKDAQAYFADAFEKFLASELSTEKVEFLSNCIKAKNKDIEKLFRVWNRLQANVNKSTEKIRDLLYWWWLEQCLYLWNEAFLKDSVLWDDIDSQLRNIIDMYKNKDYVESHWLSLPKTLLLFGWPSSWKGFAAKLLATEMWRKMYMLKSEDIWGLGDPMETLWAIFSLIEEKKEPCIVFLDEIDKIMEIVKDPNYQESLWSVILKNISRFKNSDLDILIIWAISNKNIVDDRFFKYENFEKQLFLSELDREKKWKMFEILVQKYSDKGIDFSSLDKQKIVDRLSFPQDGIKELVKNAVENAVIRNLWEWWEIQVLDSDFEKAFNFLASAQSQKNKKYFNK